MKRIRHDVAAFCERHHLILDTPGDWRVMDIEQSWTHLMFGSISEGITDGVVCWCLLQSGQTAFVHLDLCHGERLPNLTFATTRTVSPTSSPKERIRPTRVPSRRTLLETLLSGVDY